MQVLTQACDTAADQLITLAEQQSSNSTMIDPAAVQLLDEATFSGFSSLWEFENFWSKMGPVIASLLAHLPRNSNNRAQNAAILAAEGLATVSPYRFLSTPCDSAVDVKVQLADCQDVN